jgi:heme oxygenase (biliverdin-IX-beta and delta-forming)
MPALSIVSPGIAQPVRGSAPKSAAARGLRALLRDKTKAAHRRLDSAISVVELRSAPHYARFLEAHAEALLPLEATLAASGVRRLFPDWERRVRSPALLEDIARLGGATPPFDLLEPSDDAGMLGAMYVLEGSRLGATVLLEAVLQSPDPGIRDATAYLSHGAQERLWPSFLTALEFHGATLDDTTAAVASARQAFARYEAALSRAFSPVAATIAASDRP